MTELKPCPFCNGKAEIETIGDRRKSTMYACTECGCRLETGEEFNHGNQWNTRSETNDRTQLLLDALEFYADSDVWNGDFINEEGETARNALKDYEEQK